MSSNYSNYRLKINGSVLNDTMISKGTYSLEKEFREIASWRDANGIEHIDNHADLKTTISFELRERSLAEQESIVGMFSTLENITVKYWDDMTADYITGYFWMHPPEFSHLTIQKDDIRYDTTEITLEEY